MKPHLIPVIAWLGVGLVVPVLPACSSSTASNGASSQTTAPVNSPLDLDPYWYQGKGEVTSYDLSQGRYRDVHPGSAVLVFVSEDFLTDKQVKNESYRSDATTKVLKVNAMRHFPTGIYDYSIMTSVFSPADTRIYPHALKVTMSAQDWCGQAFVQINRREKDFQLQQFSYFEQEGDVDVTINQDVWLEDEMWTRLRMDPMSLPTGSVKVLPSLMALRLLHMANEPIEARASLAKYEGSEFTGNQLQMYSLQYPNRSLEIVFEAASPYQIVGWVETNPAMGVSKTLRTVAKKKETVLVDYWSKNGLADSVYRVQLGL